MLKTRVIPVLYTEDFVNTVQTSKYSKRRPVGTLMQHVINMDKRDVDEVMIVDISVDRYSREPLYERLKEVAKEIYSPLTYGGGICCIQEIEKCLKSGADKVLIGYYAYKNPTLIKDAVRIFGAQAIVLSVDVYELITSVKSMSIFKILECEPGEILLNCTQKNGTRGGYDLHSISTLANMYSTLPIVANCGCGEPAHMAEAIKAGAHAVASSSMFLFTEYTPKDCSQFLNDQGIPARV